MSSKAKIKWMENGGENPLVTNKVLFEAALAEFSTHSFKDASLNDIIRNAGMNKGSFYYRFHDKLDMYLSLLHCMGLKKGELYQQYDQEKTSGGFFEEIRQKAVLGLYFAQKEPGYHALWRRVMAEEPAVRGAISASFGDLTTNVMAEMIDRAKAAGELRSDVSTKTAAFVVSTLMDRLDLLVPQNFGDEAILAGLDDLLEILQYGMRK